MNRLPGPCGPGYTMSPLPGWDANDWLVDDSGARTARSMQEEHWRSRWQSDRSSRVASATPFAAVWDVLPDCAMPARRRPMLRIGARRG